MARFLLHMLITQGPTHACPVGGVLENRDQASACCEAKGRPVKCMYEVVGYKVAKSMIQGGEIGEA